MKKNNSKSLKGNKNFSKTEKKSKTKSKKIIEEDDDSEEIDEFEISNEDDIEEIQEKKSVEKAIKGKSLILDLPDESHKDRKIDNAINKTLEKDIKQDDKSINKVVKKTKKEATIDSIIDAYQALNLEEMDRMTKPALKSTKLNILEQKLKDLTERIAKEIIKVPENNVETKNGEGKRDLSPDFQAECLFNVNLIMAQFVENIAEVGKQNKITKDYVPNISGFTKRLLKDDKKEQLKKCLREIIKEHGEMLAPYMNPIAMWSMIMISTASEQIIENASEEAKKNSIDTTVTT
jgi:hypothetical protein